MFCVNILVNSSLNFHRIFASYYLLLLPFFFCWRWRGKYFCLFIANGLHFHLCDMDLNIYIYFEVLIFFLSRLKIVGKFLGFFLLLKHFFKPFSPRREWKSLRKLKSVENIADNTNYFSTLKSIPLTDSLSLFLYFSSTDTKSSIIFLSFFIPPWKISFIKKSQRVYVVTTIIIKRKQKCLNKGESLSEEGTWMGDVKHVIIEKKRRKLRSKLLEW